MKTLSACLLCAALLVAGKALEHARAENVAVDQALRAIIVATPLGQVRFIDFGGYYQQNPAGAVVQSFAGDRPRTVFPFGRQPAVNAHGSADALTEADEVFSR